MNRVRMANVSDLPLDLSNEIIDLTGDSPVVNSAQFRASRPRNLFQYRRPSNNAERNLPIRGDSPILYDPLTSVERDNSFIQIIDPDENQLMVRLADEAEFGNMMNIKSNEEYSTAVPCLSDSCSGQQVVLSCPICFEPLAAERIPMATNCGHIFCGECLKTTLQRSTNKSCPKCNSTVKIKSCIRLYF